MNAQKKLKDAREVLAILEAAGFESRLAGGCVRDRLMGVEPKDYDAATQALPDAICRIFEQKSYKVIPTGIDHGTITVLTSSGPVEVTTLRFDLLTDGRHATVSFEKATFEDDAARRDFTINAMFEDKTGKVYDYFGGEEDLKQKRLRFVGDARERIKEDYLRILRLFRFWGKLEGFTPEPSSLAAIKSEVGGLKRVSVERILSELMLLFGYRDIAKPLQALIDTGTLQVILPQPGTTQKVSIDAVNQLGSLDVEWRSIARFAAVTLSALHKKETEELGEHFKLSRTQNKQLTTLRDLPAALKKLGAEAADHMQLVDHCEEHAGDGSFAKLCVPYIRAMHSHDAQVIRALDDVERTERVKGHLRTAVLPIDGKKLMHATGLAPGERLGMLLTRLKRSFRNGEWADEAEGLRIAQTYLTKRCL